MRLARFTTVALTALVATAASGAASAHPAPYRHRHVRSGRAYDERGAAGYYPVRAYVGGGLMGTGIASQEGGPEILESGGGGVLWGGLRFSQLFALELGFMGSFHNPAVLDDGTIDHLVLTAATLDGKFYLGDHPFFEPYVQAGLGVYALGSENFGTDSTGGGFQLGGGIDWWLSPWITFGGRLLYRGTSMGPPDSTVDDTFISVVTGEFNLGLHF